MEVDHIKETSSLIRLCISVLTERNLHICLEAFIPVSISDERSHIRCDVHCQLSLPRFRKEKFVKRSLSVTGRFTWNTRSLGVVERTLSFKSICKQT